MYVGDSCGHCSCFCDIPSVFDAFGKGSQGSGVGGGRINFFLCLLGTQGTPGDGALLGFFCFCRGMLVDKNDRPRGFLSYLYSVLDRRSCGTRIP